MDEIAWSVWISVTNKYYLLEKFVFPIRKSHFGSVELIEMITIFIARETHARTPSLTTLSSDPLEFPEVIIKKLTFNVRQG